MSRATGTLVLEAARHGGSYALYHLPGESQYVELTQRSRLRGMSSTADWSTLSGFVIAPFLATPSRRPLLLQSDTERRLPLPPASRLCADPLRRAGEQAERERYATAFGRCKRLLTEGACRKIVLARTRRCLLDDAPTRARTFFYNACHRYPHCFTTLFHTPQTGTWLVSTPETLLRNAEGEEDWCTMSLAGTMACAEGLPPAPEAWAEKDRKEQALVTDFICDQLGRIGREIRTDGPRAHRVGRIAHLRTDIRFRLQEGYGTVHALAALHPTPATCGLPRRAAIEAICAAETEPRRCYAGFCGPLRRTEGTQLYVSLRCMEIKDNELLLHAGGGLLPESDEDAEWEETCRKMESIESVCSAIITT